MQRVLNLQKQADANWCRWGSGHGAYQYNKKTLKHPPPTFNIGKILFIMQFKHIETSSYGTTEGMTWSSITC